MRTMIVSQLRLHGQKAFPVYAVAEWIECFPEKVKIINGHM
jgi:hypothetical protein